MPAVRNCLLIFLSIHLVEARKHHINDIMCRHALMQKIGIGEKIPLQLIFSVRQILKEIIIKCTLVTFLNKFIRGAKLCFRNLCRNLLHGIALRNRHLQILRGFAALQQLHNLPLRQPCINIIFPMLICAVIALQPAGQLKAEYAVNQLVFLQNFCDFICACSFGNGNGDGFPRQVHFLCRRVHHVVHENEGTNPDNQRNRNEKQPLGKTCQMAFFMVLFPAVRRSFRFSRSARPLLLVRNALSAAGDLCLSSLLSSCLSSLMRGSLIGVLSFVGILIGILQKFCPSCGCPLFVCCHIVFRIYLPSGQLCMMLRRKAQRTAFLSDRISCMPIYGFSARISGFCFYVFFIESIIHT